MKYMLSLLFALILSGCVSSPEPLVSKNSSLTQGNVQMNVQTGLTTKAEILEVFGAPNVTTRDGAGKEVWTYQRQAQVTQRTGEKGYWTVLLAGKSKSVSGFESSSRMITLILKFDANDVVTDFNSRASNF